jgi:hypothetical protein
MRRLALFICLLAAVPVFAQKEKREPLTAAQIDALRDATVYPDARLHLYNRFLDEHAAAIKALIPRAHSAARARQIDDELQDFTSLLDEANDNLDVYIERRSDVRKALKPLTESVTDWQKVLDALPSEPAFELARKEALASLHDLSDQATTALRDQTEYFKIHKEERNQERAEPK